MNRKKLLLKPLGLIISVLAILAISLSPTALASNSKDIKAQGPQISVADQAIIDLGYVPDEVVVKFKESKINLKNGNAQVKADGFRDKHTSEISKTKKELKFANTAVYKIGDNDVLTVIEKLKKDNDVETVTPNYVFTFFSGTNDPYYTSGDLWGLDNTTSGNDIQADEAWDIATGGTSKIIAVLDTGVSYDHPDLDGNMWDGSSCVDENGSALNDCVHGYDFVNDDKDPADDWGHGTHMAGIIGAEGNNSTGITGVNQTANIMAVKVGNAYGTFADIIAGIQFAQENGADIINASFGGTYLAWADYSGMRDAIEDFVDTGLFIAAAGNSWNDNDATGIFPAGFEFDNLIAVTASDDSDDFVEDYSDIWGANWGEETVDLFAPGSDIYSTFIQNQTFLNFDPDTDVTKNSPWYDDTISSIDYLLTNSGTYSNNASASAITDSIDLSGSIDENSAVIYFDTWCDTETSSDDYVELFVRKDSGSWSSALPDLNTGETEISEDNLIEADTRDSYLGTYGKFGAQIPSSYLDDDTEFKFEWTTDSTNTGGPYRGCRFSDIYVSYIADGETGSGSTSYYESYGATSAASAFTSGVATLVWNEYTSLTADQVRQIILDSGDSIDNEHPTTSDPLTVTGKRLNAYRALVLAGQVDSGQEEVFVYPTVSSTTGGGNWSSTSTWEGGVVPVSTDVVEINGTVTLNANKTIAGLLVNTGKTLRSPSSSGTYTLTLSGSGADFANNGNVLDISLGHINISVDGDVENTGTLNGQALYANGDLYNSGSLSMNTGLDGNLVHSGTSDAYLTFEGSSAQTATLTGTLGNINVMNDVTLAGDLTATYLKVFDGYTLTFDSGDTVTVNGNTVIDGDITGGELVIGGGSVYFYGDGDLDVDLTFSGTGTKTTRHNKTISGDLNVGTGVNLRPYGGGYTWFYYVGGDTTVDGAITDIGGGSYGHIYLMLYGSLYNNGTMNNYVTYAYWDSTGADTYDFQVTNTSDEWQTAESTGTYTFKNIHSYRTEDRRWRWASVNGGERGAWSSDRYIVND